MQTTINIIVLIAVLVLWAAYKREVESREKSAEDRVRDLIREDYLIQAIKAHRILFGSSLKDAKDWCDAEKEKMRKKAGR